MSTNALIDAVLKRVPNADPAAVLDLIVSCDADLNKVYSLLGVQTASKKRQMTFTASTTRRPSKVSKTSADVVHLFTPEQVRDAGIHCTLYFDFLDASAANVLASDLKVQSEIWPHRSFYLFDRKVTSGHASILYTDDEEYLSGDVVSTYQGRRIEKHEILPFTTEMGQARDKIAEVVHEITPDWDCRLLIANMYMDRSEKLDYHSDQLTHIGPKPTIASLSLGCTREFRLRDRTVPPQRPIYAIHLPHNALLIMHDECQERFKHCVPPASSIDEDPLLGSMRISLTFRMYRPEFSEDKIPRCSCDTPMVLRNTLPTKEGEYKYIWQCGQHYISGKGCNESRLYTINDRG